ncbi:MAG: 50S ribosomal protein L18 [Deltaproteobacteria bacterium]|nr:50S ribosomal protein L18 [Deltaproteobacteria bacterium]
MGKTSPRLKAWQKRKVRVRRKIQGTAQRPRLCVYRSLNHIYAQVIDDVSGVTLAAASTLSPEVRSQEGHKGNIKAAKMVGKAVAEKAKSAGIIQVIFDRNGFLFHGRVKALADAAREGGLEF